MDSPSRKRGRGGPCECDPHGVSFDLVLLDVNMPGMSDKNEAWLPQIRAFTPAQALSWVTVNSPLSPRGDKVKILEAVPTTNAVTSPSLPGAYRTPGSDPEGRARHAETSS